MNRKLFKLSVILSFLVFNTSCVLKSDFENIKNELEKTKLELFELKKEHQKLLEVKKQEELERNRVPFISEEQALGYINDYYGFYDRDIKFRNVVLRRISDNTFKVSLETCSQKGNFSDDDFFWSSSVRTLKVYMDGKYDF
jgi:hypothetical protein